MSNIHLLFSLPSPTSVSSFCCWLFPLPCTVNLVVIFCYWPLITFLACWLSLFRFMHWTFRVRVWDGRLFTHFGSPHTLDFSCTRVGRIRYGSPLSLSLIFVLVRVSLTGSQADGWADRQTNRQTDKQTDRPTDRTTDRQTDRVWVSVFSVPPHSVKSCGSIKVRVCVWMFANRPGVRVD